MKKTLLFLAILPSILFAQIGPIQTQENTYEFISGNNLYRSTADNLYTLQIISDNQFETTAVKLELGHGADTAMISLKSIYDVANGEDGEFKLQGYNFAVRYKRLYACNTGILEYTAGKYMIRSVKIASVMYDLLKKKNMPLGNVHVSYYDKSSVFIHYDTYGFHSSVSFYNMSLPWSHEYTRGDVISDDDIRLILKAIQNPNAYRSKTAKSGAYVLEKEQLIKVCETILSK